MGKYKQDIMIKWQHYMQQIIKSICTLTYFVVDAETMVIKAEKQ